MGKFGDHKLVPVKSDTPVGGLYKCSGCDLELDVKNDPLDVQLKKEQTPCKENDERPRR